MSAVEVFLQPACTKVFTADGLQPLASLGAVPASLGVATQVTEHGACLYRGELILVPQQHQACMGRQSVQQVGHHFQVDHRGFVHHQHIQRQRVTDVMTEVTRARSAT